MKKTEKPTPRLEAAATESVLGVRLADLMLNAATQEQGLSGRGVLWVNCVSDSLAWTYKPVADCAEEAREWAELEGLLSSYEPGHEVIICLFDGAAEFFRVPLAADPTSA